MRLATWNDQTERLLKYLGLSAALFFVPVLLALAGALLANSLVLEGAGRILGALGHVMARPPGVIGILAKNTEATVVALGAAALLPSAFGRLHPDRLVLGGWLVANGVAIGVLLGIASVMSGVSAWSLFVAGIAPHGVVEVPAFLFAAVLGWDIVHAKAQAARRWGIPLSTFGRVAKMYCLVVVPLLAAAAYMEHTYSTRLLDLVLRLLLTSS